VDTRTKTKRSDSQGQKSSQSIRLAAALRYVQERYKGIDQLIAVALVTRGWNKVASYSHGMGELVDVTGLHRRTIQRALAEMIRRGDLRRFAQDGESNRRNGWGGRGVRYVWTSRFTEAAAALPRTPTSASEAPEPSAAANPSSTRDALRAAYVAKAKAHHGARFGYREPSPEKWAAIEGPIEAFATERGRDAALVASSVVDRYLRRTTKALEEHAHPLAWLGGDVVSLLGELGAHYDRVARERAQREHESSRSSTPPLSGVLRRAMAAQAVAACMGGM